MNHLPFFEALIQAEIKTKGMSGKVVCWIQESCRSFVLIHPDITVLSIPFEKERSGILRNHRRSHETKYHMLLNSYCTSHLLVDIVMAAFRALHFCAGTSSEVYKDSE